MSTLADKLRAITKEFGLLADVIEEVEHGLLLIADDRWHEDDPLNARLRYLAGELRGEQ